MNQCQSLTLMISIMWWVRSESQCFTWRISLTGEYCSSIKPEHKYNILVIVDAAAPPALYVVGQLWDKNRKTQDFMHWIRLIYTALIKTFSVLRTFYSKLQSGSFPLFLFNALFTYSSFYEPESKPQKLKALINSHPRILVIF